MKRVLRTVVTAVVILSAVACGNKTTQQTAKEDALAKVAEILENKIEPVYAKGFSVRYVDNGVRLVDIQDPEKENANTYHFALVPRGVKPGALPTDYAVIETPVNHVICMTTLQISNFLAIKAYDKLAGMTSARHLFDKELNNRLNNGQIVKIGIEGNFDNEVILSVNPDVIFISPFKPLRL